MKWWDVAFAAAEGVAGNFTGGNLSSGVLFKAGFVVVTLYVEIHVMHCELSHDLACH